MDFALTPEQAELRRTLEAFFARRDSVEARRAAARTAAGWQSVLWRDMADLGLLALPLDVDRGGFGGDPVALMLVMEALGAALVAEPFVETIAIGATLLKLAGGGSAAQTLQSIAAGHARLAFAWCERATDFDLAHTASGAMPDGAGWRLHGRKIVVTGAPQATAFIVTARTPSGVSLFLVDADAPGVSLEAYSTLDGRGAADVHLDNVRLGPDRMLGPDGAGLLLAEYAADSAIAALCAEAVGIMRRMQRDTIAYLKQRHQFGRPLAEFQVLQHRIADMHMQVEMAVSALHLATLKLHAPAAERARACSAAKVTVNKACRFVGQNAIQLHGGMGMTDDLPVSHAFRRATVIEMEFGTTAYHLDRFARLTEAAAA